MKKRGKKRIGSVVILVICLGMIVVALSQLVPALLDYRKSKEGFEQLNQEFVHVDPGETPEDEKDSEEDWWIRDVSIDFAELQKENPDVVAWLRFDEAKDLDISYPVMFSGDDEKYLRRDLYGNSRIAGSIFLSGHCKPDFSDYHSLIYGHNMRNGTMFGSLKKYKNEEGFYQAHPYFTLYTKDRAYRYQIFSYHDVSDDSDIYTVGFGPDDTYEEFIDRMVASSWEDTGIHPKKEDKTLTLSTCSASGSRMRFVVHAVCVAEKVYAD